MKKAVFILILIFIAAVYLLIQQLNSNEQNFVPASQQQNAEPQNDNEKSSVDEVIKIDEEEKIKAGFLTLDIKKIRQNKEKEASGENDKLIKAFKENKELLEKFPELIKTNFRDACIGFANSEDSFRKCYKGFQAFLQSDCQRDYIGDRIKCYGYPDIKKFRDNFKE